MIDAANNQAPINLGTLIPEGGAPGDQSYNPQLADPGLVLVSSDVYLVDPGNEFDGYRVLFGQKRAAPNLSTKKEVPDYLKGRSIKDVATDLDNGKLAVDQIHIEVFEYNGVLVSTNTRGLAP